MNYKFINAGSMFAVIYAKNGLEETFSGTVSPEQALKIEEGNLTYEELQYIFYPKLREAVRKREEREELLNELDDCFTISDNRVIVKGIDVGLPELFIKEYKQSSDTRKKALLRFWYWCALNPDPNARDGLFRFVKESGISITNKGYLIVYRNVKLLKEGDRDLNLAIGKEYVKIKRWKKSPSKYHLVRKIDGDFTSIPTTKLDSDSDSYSVVGNLESLYKERDDSSETTYTWAYNSTGQGIDTTEIKIGVPFRMQREFCDPNPSNACSRGLHFTSWEQLYGYAVGDKTLAILVNPMHVVAVPYSYEGKKARCCEYIPVAEVTEPISNTSEVFDYEYEEFALEELQKMLEEATGDGQEIIKLDEIPDIFLEVESTLEERQEALKDRYEYYYEDEEEDEYYREDDDISWYRF